MTALDLLDELRAAGVVLSAQADRLSFDAHAGTMTPARLAALKDRKGEVLALLAGDYRAATVARLERVGDAQDRDVLAETFDERAALCEIDAGMERAGAERAAYIELAQAVEALPLVDAVAQRIGEQLDALRPYACDEGAVALVDPAAVGELVGLGLLAEGAVQ